MQVKQTRTNKLSMLSHNHLGSRYTRKFSDATETELICKMPKLYKQKAPKMLKAFPAIEIQKTDLDDQSAYSEFET